MRKQYFCKTIIDKIEKDKLNKLDIKIEINKIFCKNKIDFDIDFKNDIFKKVELYGYKLSLIFNNTLFNGKVEFKDISLENLEFRDVVFKEHIGIKRIKVNHLIMKPYEVNDMLIIDNGEYATKKGVISSDNKDCYINNFEFEEPHRGNAKIYITGISKKTKADFRNKNLENVIFKNCNFEQTYFLNAMLKDTKFMNCTFPIIKDTYSFGTSTSKLNIISFIIISFIIISLLILYNFNESLYENFYILIISIPILLLLLIMLLYFLYKQLSKLMSLKNTLFFKHIGIKDEIDVKDKITILNIKNIYDDLKFNFINNGNPQYAGDFYYSSSLLKISKSNNFIEMISLQASYVINGFGERALKPFISIIILLVIIGSILNPNQDYISTTNTPSFLLETLPSKNKTVAQYDTNNFLKISEVREFKNENNNTYGFDNRYDYNYKEQYIPKLKDNFQVKLYYATSHIITPFTQENKKWFKNVSEKSYYISIPMTILLWLFMIGMFKSIFNRIKR